VADERKLAQRKENLRRFGAGWIRPPGVAKTYQATMDELAEREEQEALAAREARMLELANAAEMEAERQRLAAEGGNEAQIDLDDAIPEAPGVNDEEEEEGDEVEGETEDVTFNEESMLEGSMLGGSMVPADVEHMLEMEEAELLGAAQEERDLDEDVPEGGSYQHTDTEVEDSSDVEQEAEQEDASMLGFRERNLRGLERVMQSMQSVGRGRESLESMVGSEGESSWLGSSPALRRAPPPPGTNAFRDRLMQGRRQQ